MVDSSAKLTTGKIPVSEASIKKSINDFLQYQANLGHLVYLRLNAGSFIISNSDGSFRRRIKGVPAGTADFVVFQSVSFSLAYAGQFLNSHPPAIPATRVTFIEVKKPKGGKQSQAQKEFEEKVTEFHAHYYIVRDVSELEDILQL